MSVEDTGVFMKIFNEAYNQCEPGQMTKEIYQLISKLALVISEQETAKTAATTATTEMSADTSPRQLIQQMTEQPNIQWHLEFLKPITCKS